MYIHIESVVLYVSFVKVLQSVVCVMSFHDCVYCVYFCCLFVCIMELTMLFTFMMLLLVYVDNIFR